MKQTVNYTDFYNAFKAYDRLSNFPEGLQGLFDYLEQYEDDTGEQIELDVIALCCDYNEESLADIKANYSNLNIESLDDLRDHTTVVWVDDEDAENPTVIYQAF
jgi:hypothetical protein